MKKSALIGLNILSVFLLCSLSYNPIIAEKLVIQQTKYKISIENEDCECNNYKYPIRCFLVIIRLWFYLIFGFWILNTVLKESIDTIMNVWGDYLDKTWYMFDLYCVD